MKQKKELIAGQCENCGDDYRFRTYIQKPIICPHCNEETQNWDTVGYSQMAPSLVMLYNDINQTIC